MQQHLKLKALVTRIVHIQHRLQPIFTQRNTVHQAEVVRPRLPRVGA